MVCKWGMSEQLGPQSFGNREEFLFHGREVTRSLDISEDTARGIDSEVARILREAHEKALQILRDHREQLEIVTRMLIERETLDGREVLEIMKHGRILSDAERNTASGSDAPPAAPPPAPATSQPPASDTPPLLGPSAPKPSLA
jgi:cell division protease FtsH